MVARVTSSADMANDTFQEHSSSDEQEEGMPVFLGAPLPGMWATVGSQL